jgi:hypothetical protein
VTQIISKYLFYQNEGQSVCVGKGHGLGKLSRTEFRGDTAC